MDLNIFNSSRHSNWPGTMPEPSCLSIVGVDVRALAQSARRGGRRVIGIDGFCDLDTREACVRTVRADGCSGDALADAALATVLGGQRAELIIGGGFDARPDLMRRLERSFRIRGNGPWTAGLLSDARSLFGLLDRLGIPYPPISHRLPAMPDEWLLKDTASCGGQAVVPATMVHEPDAAAGTYFQQRVFGRIVSVVFAANGSEAVIIGYSRLFSQAVSGRPFGYAGAIGWAGPNQGQQRILVGWIDALTHALGLRGINGIDLILRSADSAPLLLDINARPTASLELHEDRLPAGGVQCHLDACNGHLPRPARFQSMRGSRVVYTLCDTTIAHRPWPAWCSDRPPPGERIAAGEPLCSVQASGTDSRAIEYLLAGRAGSILHSFDHSESQAA